MTSTHSYADAQSLLNKIIDSTFCDTVDLTPKKVEPGEVQILIKGGKGLIVQCALRDATQFRAIYD